MGKKKVILIVVTALLAVSGLAALPSGNITGGVGCIIIAAVCAYFAFRPAKAKAAAVQQDTKQAAGLQEKIRTKVVGVTYKNDDGTDRQELLAAMTGLEHITIEKYTYNGEPAAYVKWDNDILGNLAADLAKDLARKYPDAEYKAEILELTGGDGKSIGCNIEISIIE